MKRAKRHSYSLKLRGGSLELGARTLVMGVINVTPDSFSDGGEFLDPAKAARHALKLQKAGADLLDIGGESTRPGSESITPEQEMARVIPVLERLRGKVEVPISIDTCKADVAREAVKAGAALINDVSGLRSDPNLGRLAARLGVPIVLMHIRGTPRTMQKLAPVANLWSSLDKGLNWSLEEARRAGIARKRILIDPGIGFGKTAEQSFEILRELNRLSKFKLPIVVGPSRKSFLGKALDDAPPDKRIWGTAATVTAAILSGAHIVRVHDVEEMVQVVRVADAVLRG